MQTGTPPLQIKTDTPFSLFERTFSTSAQWLASAPGRVNLIGEHTDYNLLPVLPMSIDRKIRLYGITRSDSLVRVANAEGEFTPLEIDLAQSIVSMPGHWTNYLRAAMQAIVPEISAAGRSPVGFDIMVDSDLPPAAGLSSSSALVIATCLALLKVNNLTWSPEELADRMTQAEKFVGTAGGGMDQTIISLGEQQAALLIEFDPLKTNRVLVPESLAVFIINSGQRAEKTGSARYHYNRRSLECRLAVALLARFAPASLQPQHWTTLRDVYVACRKANMPWSELLLNHLPTDPPLVSKLSDILGAEDLQKICASRQLPLENIDEWLPNGTFEIYSRAAHVLSEADRVYGFAESMINGDIAAVNMIANASHASCRDLYQISTPLLERIASDAILCGAGAARITGAGFGGCLVAFVPADKANGFEGRLESRGIPAESIIRARPGGRAGVEDI